ncbi:AAA15 family ATPase/GTPase [Rhodanobacter sp. TND4EL1]
MRLSSAQIVNFRSLKDITINFEPRCRILIGLNEAGKSNILAALALLDRGREILSSDVREVGESDDPSEDSTVSFLFKFDRGEREKISEAISAQVESAKLSELLRYKDKQPDEHELDQWFAEGFYEVDVKKGLRTFYFWLRDDDLQVAPGWLIYLPRWQRVLSPSPPGGLQDISKVVFSELQIPSDNSDDFRPLTLDDISILIKNEVTSLIEKNLPACLYWSYSEANLLPGRIILGQFENDPHSCEPLRQMFALAGHGDAGSAIRAARDRKNGLHNLLNRVATSTTQHIRSVWKEASELEISLRPDGEFIDASVKDKHNFYEVSRRSDGFKRFISFLIMVSAKAKTSSLKNTLYLHDEPDLGIHPSGIPYLLQELIKISTNNYVVVSTHSIFMVDKERIDRHLMVKKNDEITGIKEVDASNFNDEEVVYNAMGYSIFQNLRRKNIIFEGWRDKHLFRLFSTSQLTGKIESNEITLSGIGLCHATE